MAIHDGMLLAQGSGALLSYLDTQRGPQIVHQLVAEPPLLARTTLSGQLSQPAERLDNRYLLDVSTLPFEAKSWRASEKRRMAQYVHVSAPKRRSFRFQAGPSATTSSTAPLSQPESPRLSRTPQLSIAPSSLILQITSDHILLRRRNYNAFSPSSFGPPAICLGKLGIHQSTPHEERGGSQQYPVVRDGKPVGSPLDATACRTTNITGLVATECHHGRVFRLHGICYPYVVLCPKDSDLVTEPLHP